MSDPYIGEIRCFGFNFAPRDWAMCNGQTLSISQYQALFSILGTTYGGNGTSNFQLPNLQGRVPMHWGTPTNLPATEIGEVQGEEQVTLLSTQMPMHNHAVFAADPGDFSERTAVPNNNAFLSSSAAPNFAWAASPTLNSNLAPNAIGNQGGSQPHENRQPFLVLNFCISLFGQFPTRN